MRVFGKLFIAVAVSLAVGFTGSMVYAEGDNTTSASGFKDSEGGIVSVSSLVEQDEIEVIGTGNAYIKATAYVDSGDQEEGGLSSGGILLGRAIGTVSGNTGSPTGAVSENERLGFIVGRGYDGSNFHHGAALTIKVDGPVTSGSVPARFTIETGSTFSDRQDRLVVKSDGKIGIGTTTPSYDLDVVGNINFTGSLYQNGSLFSSGSGGSSVWSTSGTDAYYTSGNVGIGDSTPSYDLDVTGDINFTGSLYQNGSLFSSGGSSVWSTFGTDIYYNSGNVGIGTTAPTEKLEINGTVKATNFVGGGSGLTDVSGGIPTGGIIMWSGSIASIPDGWFLCDGTSVVNQSGDVIKTPDLTDRFIIHADADSGGTRNVGDTGGEQTHQLSVSEMPSHTHQIDRGDRAPADETMVGLGSNNRYGSRPLAQSTGGNVAHNNMPKYYALAFIMKI